MALKTTWDTIRMITLQKMFIAVSDTVQENDSNREYLKAMPGAYNEAVMLLSTANRYIVKSFEVPADALGNAITVDLESVVDDLYQLKPNGIYFTDSDGRMSECDKYNLIGDRYLQLRNNKSGVYQILYFAYPVAASSATKGTDDMQLDPDVAVLVPLYMASQLYKDDDISIATQYRNEFEVGRELLIKERNGSYASKFRCITGWR